MALQNFVDKVGPVVSAAWLNAVDLLKETIFGNSTTKTQARAALTSDAPLEVANGGTGVRSLVDLSTALGGTGIQAGDNITVTGSWVFNPKITIDDGSAGAWVLGDASGVFSLKSLNSFGYPSNDYTIFDVTETGSQPVVDFKAIPTVNGGSITSTAPDFTSDLSVTKVLPSLKLEDSSGGANEKIWRVLTSGQAFYIITRSDIDGVGTNAFTATRTGTNILAITIGTSTSSVDIAGPLTFGYAAGNFFIGRRNTLTYGTTISTNTLLGNDFVITATDGVAFAIAAPTNAGSFVDTGTHGQRITYTIRNTSGGALGTVTWNSVFKMGAWVSPANGFSRSIEFRYNGTNWVELFP
jgi:hypothetical protein